MNVQGSSSPDSSLPKLPKAARSSKFEGRKVREELPETSASPKIKGIIKKEIDKTKEASDVLKKTVSFKEDLEVYVYEHPRSKLTFKDVSKSKSTINYNQLYDMFKEGLKAKIKSYKDKANKIVSYGIVLGIYSERKISKALDEQDHWRLIKRSYHYNLALKMVAGEAVDLIQQIEVNNIQISNVEDFKSKLKENYRSHNSTVENVSLKEFKKMREDPLRSMGFSNAPELEELTSLIDQGSWPKKELKTMTFKNLTDVELDLIDEAVDRMFEDKIFIKALKRYLVFTV